MISVLFLPQYFKGEMFTAYELMQRRFGHAGAQASRPPRFCMLRALAEGVRVFADFDCDFDRARNGRGGLRSAVIVALNASSIHLKAA